ncbi:biotin synthase BioB [bacterium F16]|nr:biotin synthase BioB [bacterium F16]
MPCDYKQLETIATDESAEFPELLARKVLLDDDIDVLQLVHAAGAVRYKTFGKKVKLHQINNIQNGLCPEDCGYCGQAKNANQNLKQYVMKGDDDIVKEAHEAKERGVFRYCMVASGRGPSDKTIDKLTKTVKRITDEVGIRTCLSIGLVNENQATRLKEAGLDRLNHNLNTSEQNTVNIVSTHTYQDRIDTLDAAKKAGLSTCSGMIVGMGETDDDVIEVAYKLREMNVPSIPINFLVPIEGNRISETDLTPERCLKILCLFRFINPTAEIRLGGGREGHLRGLQSLALYPANSVFVEGYLVTRGDATDPTVQMIQDAGFEVEGMAPQTCSMASQHFKIDDNPDVLKLEMTH